MAAGGLRKTFKGFFEDIPQLIPFYYYFMENAFYHEIRSVYHGVMQHAQMNINDTDDAGLFAFRRNIHRIEKGLTMRPRKSVYAESYILEVVDYFSMLASQKKKDKSHNSLIFWSRDVLDRYFDSCSKDDVINEARSRYERYRGNLGEKEYLRVPFKQKKRKFIVKYDDFMSLVLNRKSVRWYLQKPVPAELLDKAILAGLQSPSACNRQPFEIRVFDKPYLVRRIASIGGGVKGIYENFPCLMLFVGKLRAFQSERDRHLIYIDASLAAMSIVYALETLGLSSCLINWPEVHEYEKRLYETLSLSPDERVVLMMSVGYPDPDGMVCYSERRHIDEMRFFNKL